MRKRSTTIKVIQIGNININNIAKFFARKYMNDKKDILKEKS